MCCHSRCVMWICQISPFASHQFRVSSRMITGCVVITQFLCLFAHSCVLVWTFKWNSIKVCHHHTPLCAGELTRCARETHLILECMVDFHYIYGFYYIYGRLLLHSWSKCYIYGCYYIHGWKKQVLWRECRMFSKTNCCLGYVLIAFFPITAHFNLTVR